MNRQAPPAARVGGLFEAHLLVGDVGRSVAFYRDVVGLQLAYEMSERDGAFLWAGEPGTSMVGLWSHGTAPIGLQLHLAFAVSLAEVLQAPARLNDHGVQPLSFFGTPTDQASVIGWMPAASVYFTDPDGHLLEYLAMLDAPPRPELGITCWQRWHEIDADAQRPLSGRSAGDGTMEP